MILLVIVGVLIQANSDAIQAMFHVPPSVIVAVVAAIFGAAKMAYPGTAAMNKLIDLVVELLGPTQTKDVQEAPKQGMRSASVEVRPREVVKVEPGQIPKRPNRAMRVLFG